LVAKVTTSWDDGHSGDPRLAELLAGRGMTGTFYWTMQHPEFTYPGPEETQALLDMGMEIGAHTMTHPDLTRLDPPQLKWELETSRSQLEDYIQQPIRTFCYPFGYFNRRVRDAVAEAGYELARTTESFRTTTGTDPYLVPVTMQVFPHGIRTHLTHSVRRRNLPGLANWLKRHRGSSDMDTIVAQSLDHVRANGGVLHIWGHSWELERFELWDDLERLLDTLADHDDVEYVTNAALIPS
jgi:peptidoglycan/xylan/chitin deacetylase (PgdA/CDA1 family)